MKGIKGRVLECCLLIAWLALSTPAFAADDLATVPDEDLLQWAGFAVDTPSLLRFFRQRTPSPGERKRLDRLIQDLADPSFDVRVKASADLVACGPAVIPWLQRAACDDDRERARGAKESLVALGAAADPALPEAAARLLVRHHPPDAIPVLLGYLPYAAGRDVEEAVLDALSRLRTLQDRPSLDLRTAAMATDASQREAAALLLGAVADKQSLRALRPLLADPDARVRFYAAQSSLERGDKAAVRVLIELLADASLPLAWRAEGSLVRLAGTDRPSVALQGTAQSRSQCRDAWARWWEMHEADLDPTRIATMPPTRPLIVYTELDNGRIVALDSAWKEVWHLDELRGPVDFQLLPSGRLLVAENHGRRVTERDPTGRIVWEMETRTYPGSCWRQASGNTVIATKSELLEVTPERRIVWSLKWPDPLWSARPMRDGGIAILTSCGVCLLDPSRRPVNRFQLVGVVSEWGSLNLLPNGHVLLAGRMGFYVNELGKDGETAWEYEGYQLSSAARLPNGHTLICVPREDRLLEVDRRGKEIRSFKVRGRPWHVEVIP